jgi:hypothetical protein
VCDRMNAMPVVGEYLPLGRRHSSDWERPGHTRAHASN